MAKRNGEEVLRNLAPFYSLGIVPLFFVCIRSTQWSWEHCFLILFGSIYLVAAFRVMRRFVCAHGYFAFSIHGKRRKRERKKEKKTNENDSKERSTIQDVLFQSHKAAAAAAHNVSPL